MAGVKVSERHSNRSFSNSLHPTDLHDSWEFDEGFPALFWNWSFQSVAPLGARGLSLRERPAPHIEEIGVLVRPLVRAHSQCFHVHKALPLRPFGAPATETEPLRGGRNMSGAVIAELCSGLQIAGVAALRLARGLYRRPTFDDCRHASQGRCNG